MPLFSLPPYDLASSASFFFPFQMVPSCSMEFEEFNLKVIDPGILHLSFLHPPSLCILTLFLFAVGGDKEKVLFLTCLSTNLFGGFPHFISNLVPPLFFFVRLGKSF